MDMQSLNSTDYNQKDNLNAGAFAFNAMVN